MLYQIDQKDVYRGRHGVLKEVRVEWSVSGAKVRPDMIVLCNVSMHSPEISPVYIFLRCTGKVWFGWTHNPHQSFLALPTVDSQ